MIDFHECTKSQSLAIDRQSVNITFDKGWYLRRFCVNLSVSCDILLAKPNVRGCRGLATMTTRI